MAAAGNLGPQAQNPGQVPQGVPVFGLGQGLQGGHLAGPAMALNLGPQAQQPQHGLLPAPAQGQQPPHQPPQGQQQVIPAGPHAGLPIGANPGAGGANLGADPNNALLGGLALHPFLLQLQQTQAHMMQMIVQMQQPNLQQGPLPPLPLGPPPHIPPPPPVDGNAVAGNVPPGNMVIDANMVPAANIVDGGEIQGAPVAVDMVVDGQQAEGGAIDGVGNNAADVGIDEGNAVVGVDGGNVAGGENNPAEQLALVGGSQLQDELAKQAAALKEQYTAELELLRAEHARNLNAALTAQENTHLEKLKALNATGSPSKRPRRDPPGDLDDFELGEASGSGETQDDEDY